MNDVDFMIFFNFRQEIMVPERLDRSYGCNFAFNVKFKLREWTVEILIWTHLTPWNISQFKTFSPKRPIQTSNTKAHYHTL